MRVYMSRRSGRHTKGLCEGREWRGGGRRGVSDRGERGGRIGSKDTMKERRESGGGGGRGKVHSTRRHFQAETANPTASRPLSYTV